MFIETPKKELINLMAVSKVAVEELSHGDFKEVLMVFYGLDGKTRVAVVEFENKEEAKKWMVNQVYAAALKCSR